MQVSEDGTCAHCGGALDQLRVCSQCGFPAALTAWQRIEQLADRGSFQETERHLKSGDPIRFSDGPSSYEKQLAAAQAATGLLDAVVTGRARLLGRRVMIAVFDFQFRGGEFSTRRHGQLPSLRNCLI